MLCDRVLGNVHDEPPARYAGKAQDILEITWRDCTRRALRARTESGRRIGVLLPLGAALRHGDVLLETEQSVVVVGVTPVEVWVADFPDAASMAAAALELGNFHVPVEIGAGAQLVALPDGPTRGVFDRYAATWRPEVRRFTPLRATVTAGAVRLAERFAVAPVRPQLTNSRE